MASAAREPNELCAQRAGDIGAGGAVILDSGTTVEVAVIDCGRPLRVGMRFEHGGRLWEITRAKDHERGWVARPARGGVLRTSR